MRRSLIVIVLAVLPALGAAAQTTAPPLCPQGKWPVRSSHNISGWECTDQTTTGDQSSDSNSTTEGRHRGMGGGGFGMGGGGLGSGYGGPPGQ